MITSLLRNRLSLTRLVIVGLLLGACGNPRNDAATELERLHEAMQRHAAQYHRYPDTLDAGRPASATNLPYAPRRDVAVRLVGSTADGYQAQARRKSWICWIMVGPGQPATPDCSPVSPSLRNAPDSAGQPAGGLEGVLQPGASPADSSPTDSAGGP